MGNDVDSTLNYNYNQNYGSKLDSPDINSKPSQTQSTEIKSDDAEIANGIYITIKCQQRPTTSIKINPLSTIKDLKSAIKDKMNLDENYSFLVFLDPFQQKSLEHEECNLTAYNIKPDSMLYVKLKPRRGGLADRQVTKWDSTKITIKTLTGKSVELEVKPFHTIKQLKIRIQDQLKVYHKFQRLIYAGIQLEDNQQLMDVNVAEGATIHLVERMVDIDWSFNELLCDDAITPINSVMDGNQYDGYFGMYSRFILTSQIDRNNHELKMEKVYKINKNYDHNMSIYNALLTTYNTKENKSGQQMLFHGTSLPNISKILYSGFNRDYNIKSLYGKGTYFSNEAKIAAEYCTKFDQRNIFAMLACRCYVGDWTKGNLYMSRSELYKDDKITQYDSLVNDVRNPSIFVINRDYHAVPTFIIVFTIRESGK